MRRREREAVRCGGAKCDAACGVGATPRLPHRRLTRLLGQAAAGWLGAAAEQLPGGGTWCSGVPGRADPAGRSMRAQGGAMTADDVAKKAGEAGPGGHGGTGYVRCTHAEYVRVHRVWYARLR